MIRLYERVAARIGWRTTGWHRCARERRAYDIAQIYAGLGDKDQAFAWLEKADMAQEMELTF